MNSIQKNDNFKKYILNYTFYFLLLSVVVFSLYIFTGKTFIYNGDGQKQYIPVYIFWSNYLRDFFRTIFIDHSFVIRQWDFSIGEGADVLPELSYNIVGDPFAFFSVFVPAKYMYIYYSFMSLLRLYVAGLAFSFMCFKISQKSTAAVLGGTLSYVFFQYAIYNVTKHPHFLNILIYFPLMITGAEELLKKKSPLIFLLAVFLSAFTSFYFFYMAVILIIAYVMVRLFTLYSSDFKKILAYVLKFLLYGIWGTCLAALVLIPTLATVLHDSRQNMFGHIPLFYELKYYLYLPSVFTSVTGTIDGTHWLIFAFPVPVLLALYQLFSMPVNNGERKTLKNLFITCFIFVLFPVFGLLLNGFQYPSNRWGWGFALLCSYILVNQWNKLQDIQKSRKGFIVLLILLVSSLYNFRFLICSLIQFLIFISFIFAQKRYTSEKNSVIYNRIVLLSICASVSCTSFFLFSPLGVGFSSRALKRGDFAYLEQNEAVKIKELNSQSDSPNSFFRYSGRDLTSDIGMVEGMSSVQYYISLTNPKIQEFRESIEFNQAGDLHKYSGYDGRTVLDAISSVKYFYKPESDVNPVPYGFVPTLDKTIFINQFALPIAFAYSNVIPRKDWDSLSPIQKQECLLQSVVLEENECKSFYGKDGLPSSLQEATTDFLNKKIPYTLELSDGLTRNGNSLEVLKPNSSIYVYFNGLTDSETYISLENLTFNQISEFDLTKKNHDSLSCAKRLKFSIKKLLGLKKIDSTPIKFETSLKSSNTLDYKTPHYTWYANRHSFCINMGYTKEAVSSVKITFTEPGLYTLDKLNVICLPMSNYAENTASLKKYTLQNESMSTNRITGKITLPTTKVLYFSIPYSEGWSAKVDGKSVPLLQANVMHMGIVITEGTHDIELAYHTPFLRTGIIISIISFILLIVFFIVQKRKNG